MDNNNPYQAPAATIAEGTYEGELASRWARLGAAIIDTIILVAILLPIMFANGYMEVASQGAVPFGTTVMYAVLGFVIFVLVQGYPLATSAQTWGKKLLGIRIEGMDGTRPSLMVLLLRRYLPVQVVGTVPLVGPVFGLVNVLFIFGGNRRCVHDLIAGTRVVKC
jgi:uncharacterized RDD family membrane protein YckC